MTQSHRAQSVTDPVCGMQVDPERNPVRYMEMDFAFCSDQCKERFLANPGLYVGRPGEQAPKQRGDELVKRRRMHLAEALPREAAEGLASTLHTMMGVKVVEINGAEVEIVYDLLQATAAQIETAMMAYGARLGDRWVDRFKRALVHAVEEDVLASQEVTHSRGPSGGCH